ncbi:CvpA family protein [Alteribacter natronophilus]|uniref:CvpA family protein n=1 Tax=Alteribacter natronophilus TaxID=2583810 RepID=UPI00110DF48B|nr:CvpA family protein [Alteribacter natronophilus]TMW71656.1 CvpA family protein [Alteribacter natronophilus]
MLSLILFIVLLMSFMIGFRRGLILQLVHLLGFVAAFLVAWFYYQPFAEYIRLWIPFPTFGNELMLEAFSAEAVYYNGIAFVIIFFAVKILMQIIGSMFDFLAHLPILSTVNSWLGGALGFLEGLLIVVILVHLGAIIQIDFIQQMLQNSTVAQLIFEYTPVISNQLKELWLDVAAGETSFF